MRFESQWPGDAVAAPICGTYDQQDAFLESLGGRSSNRTDKNSDQADADPAAVVEKDWRIWDVKPVESVSSFPEPNTLRRRMATAMSFAIDVAIEGFALSAATLHPEFLLPPAEQDHPRLRVKDHPDGRPADTAPTDFAVWRTRITSITSSVIELWSKMRREREIRRIKAAWGTIDDRTLKDVGLTRCEMEFASDARRWS
jgi:uncharacterized protein YjiS (DUF1127 family)